MRLFKSFARFLRRVRWRRTLLTVVLLWLAVVLALAVAVHTYGYTDQIQEADVIIVLGAGIQRNNRPTPSHRVRTNRAAELYLEGYAESIICTGGKPWYAARSEADACREMLLERGVPDTAILLEDRSRSTEENAIYSRQIMDAHGWQTAVVVSDRYHLLRAGWLFSNVGITAYTSPSSVGYLRLHEYAWFVFRETLALQWQAVSDLLNLPFTHVPLV